MLSDAPSLWCPTCAVCASAGYTGSSGRISIYLIMRFLAGTAQYCRTFIPLSVYHWNDVADPVFDSVRLVVFKSRANSIYWHKLLYPFLLSTICPFLFFLSHGWHCTAGVFGRLGYRSLSPSLALPTSFNYNNSNIGQKIDLCIRRKSVELNPTMNIRKSNRIATFKNSLYQHLHRVPATIIGNTP